MLRIRHYKNSCNVFIYLEFTVLKFKKEVHDDTTAVERIKEKSMV